MKVSDVIIEIDPNSGFCFGVTTAINKAEQQLEDDSQPLYCLGDIVHNSAEVERLESKGLVTITHDDMAHLSNARVLLRAHGEPPTTYQTARDRGLELIDATCPVVLRLQRRIADTYSRDPHHTQIVIYGKTGHAEVNGLVGQTDGHAIVVEGPGDIDKIDFSRPVELYSQTTKSLEGFGEMIRLIESRMHPGIAFEYFDTICRQVSNRVNQLCEFAAAHDVVLFVSGSKSSNGKVLYNRCHDINPRTYMVSDSDRIDPEWITGAQSIGICGATSTPRWLMEQVRDRVASIITQQESV